MSRIDYRGFLRPGELKDCSTLAAKDLGTVEECQVAANSMRKKFSHVWTREFLPKRCHIMNVDDDNDDNDVVYWNNHTIGGTSERSEPICKYG